MQAITELLKQRGDDGRRCRWCGCSEFRPCPGGCSWAVNAAYGTRPGGGRFVNAQPVADPRPLCSACWGRTSFRIIGVDAAIGRLGYCVLDVEHERPKLADAGFWKPKTKKGLDDRWLQLADFCKELVWYYKPTDCIVEQPGKGTWGNRSKHSLQTQQRASAVSFGVFAAMRRTWTITPQRWKPTQTKGSKGRTADTAGAILGTQIEVGDIGDAAGLALWWISRVEPVVSGNLPLQFLPKGLNE